MREQKRGSALSAPHRPRATVPQGAMYTYASVCQVPSVSHCVCVNVCARARHYTHPLCVDVCVCVCARAYVRVRACVCARVCARARVCACARVCVRARACVCVCVCVCKREREREKEREGESSCICVSCSAHPLCVDRHGDSLVQSDLCACALGWPWEHNPIQRHIRCRLKIIERVHTRDCPLQVIADVF